MRNFSNLPPVILISRYRSPGIWTGSARAALDSTRAGTLRSAWRFSACLACSVLTQRVMGLVCLSKSPTSTRKHRKYSQERDSYSPGMATGSVYVYEGQREHLLGSQVYHRFDPVVLLQLPAVLRACIIFRISGVSILSRGRELPRDPWRRTSTHLVVLIGIRRLLEQVCGQI